MKKTIIALFALLALCACNNELYTLDFTKDHTPVTFNLSINQLSPNATKSDTPLKADWTAGDVVYVFFDAIPDKYIKKSYNGSTWTETYPGGEFETGDFTAAGPEASRNMTAVWLPKEMGEVTVAYAESKFSFTIGGEKIYSHYMSVHTAYTVSGTTITGTLSMQKPAGFVQFFVPGITAEEAPTYKLLESHLTPKACDYVALEGGVTEAALTSGYSIKGMAFTTDASVTGALFGGVLSSVGAPADYKFRLVKELSVEKPASLGTYTLSGNKTIAEGTSMTLPDISSGWGTLAPFVDMGYTDSPLWATGNLSKSENKIVYPLLAGEYFMYGKTTVYNSSDSIYEGTEDPLPVSADVAYSVNTDWRIPTKSQFDALINTANTTLSFVTEWTDLGDAKGGILFTSKMNGLSLFFAYAGRYVSNTLIFTGFAGRYWSSSNAHFLNIYSEIETIGTFQDDRSYGYPIRPVQN